MQFITFDEFQKRFPSGAVIDIRPAGSFRSGHLPASIHLPVLYNPEAAHNFLLAAYPDRDRYTGGLIENPPLLQALLPENPVERPRLYYCEDGGIRSGLLYRHLTRLGMDGYFLRGGFAGFLQEQEQLFGRTLQICLLTGRTGSGKTLVLNALEKLGEQVIDLEALAGSTGSAFGRQQERSQPGNQDFRNRLWAKLRTLRPEKRVFFEQKGAVIGRLPVPHGLFRQFETARKIALSLPGEERIRNLITTYGESDPEDIRAGLEKVRKNLPPEIYSACADALRTRDSRQFIAQILTYYDQTKRYQSGDDSGMLTVDAGGRTAEEVAAEIQRRLG